MLELDALPREAILDSVEQGRYEHAVFLTYSLDIPFFESSVLRPLVSRGCANIVVLGDADRISSELHRLSEPSLSTRPWALGKYYSLTPVHHSFAFHPKVFLLIGDEINVFIGSGNLEPGGLRNNLEMFHGFKCGIGDAPDADTGTVIPELWHYIRTRAAFHIPRFVGLQLARVEEAAPWLLRRRAEKTTNRLVISPGEKVVPLMREAVQGDKVQILYVLSPFFDAKLETLFALREHLKPKRLILLLQSSTVSIPGRLLKSFKGLEAYELGDIGSRYAHAKLVIAECTHSSVMLAGSHNVSSRAFEGKNYELSVLRVSRPRPRFSELLGLEALVKESAPIDLSNAQMRCRPENASKDNQTKSLLIGAQLDGNCIEIETRRNLDEHYKLVPYSVSGQGTPLQDVPVVSETVMTYRLGNPKKALEWIAVAIENEHVHSFPVPLLHVEALLEQSSPTAKQKLRTRFDSGLPDISTVEEILKDFQSLLFETSRSGPRLNKRVITGKRDQPKPEIKRLSYEDFIIPWEKTEVLQRADKVRHDLDLMIHAIAAALGETKDKPPKLHAKDELDLFSDKSLARTSDFAKEIEEKDLSLEPSLFQTNELNPDGSVKRANDGAGPNFDANQVKVPSPSKNEDFERNTRLRSIFRKIIQRYPEHLMSTTNEKEVLSFELLDQVTSAGHLITSALCRRKRTGGGHVDLVSWDDWIEFHENLLQSLSGAESRILQRFPWSNKSFEYHRKVVERFTSYLLLLYTLCKSAPIEGRDRARMMMGLFRLTRILGPEKIKGDEKRLVQNAREFFGSTIPAVSIPDFKWVEWISFVTKTVDIDLRLRRRFSTAFQIHDSGEGAKDLSVGDWVWWPHADGHIAVVVETGGSSIEAAYEPLSTKKLAQSYVKKLNINQ